VRAARGASTAYACASVATCSTLAPLLHSPAHPNPFPTGPSPAPSTPPATPPQSRPADHGTTARGPLLPPRRRYNHHPIRRPRSHDNHTPPTPPSLHPGGKNLPNTTDQRRPDAADSATAPPRATKDSTSSTPSSSATTSTPQRHPRRASTRHLLQRCQVPFISHRCVE